MRPDTPRRPSITWRPDADTTLAVVLTYQDDPKVGYYNWIPALGTVLPNINGGRLPTSLYTGEPDFDRYSERTVHVGYSFDHRLSDALTFHQNFRYSYANATFRNAYVSFFDADERTLYRYAWALGENASDVDVDSQLVAKFALGPLANTVLAGFDYQHLRVGQKLGYDFDPADVPPLDIFTPRYRVAIPLPPLASIDVQHADQDGVYIQDQIALGGLRVLFGGRQGLVHSGDTQFIDPNTGLPGPGVKTSESQNAFTGRAGLLYLFEIGLAPYVSYTEVVSAANRNRFRGPTLLSDAGSAV